MLTTGAIFSDHMVLQRGKTIPVWGYADPREWRSEWKDDKMPFLFVQLPMYIAKAQAVQGIDDRHWAMIRDQQMKVYKTVANTGLAVLTD